MHPTYGQITIQQDAAAVLQNARKVVETIRERRAAMDRAGLQGKPLFVLAGEMHNRPAHSVLHLSVLSALRILEKTAVALERPHNEVEKEYLPHLDDKARARFHAGNTEGAMSLRLRFAGAVLPHISHSSQVVLNTLNTWNMPVRMTDADRTKKDECLDHTDPSTADSLRTCFNKIYANMSAYSQAGIIARNHHMTAHLQDFAVATGARIIYQRCGNKHVAGEVVDRHDAAHSLTSRLKSRGHHVLGLTALTEVFREENIPADHGLAPHERLIVRGLPDEHFEVGDWDSFRAEAGYTNALLERMGLGRHAMTVEEMGSRQRRMAAEIRHAVKGAASSP